MTQPFVQFYIFSTEQEMSAIVQFKNIFSIKVSVMLSEHENQAKMTNLN